MIKEERVQIRTTINAKEKFLGLHSLLGNKFKSNTFESILNEFIISTKCGLITKKMQLEFDLARTELTKKERKEKREHIISLECNIEALTDLLGLEEK